ncbi:hypothetical protein N7492_002626 [Penicillium capsulatum]|uniref:Uncharacterized protein n=1 Tax=Penicillium capsulatum TaxID=69766 RepID=A0A9W9IPF6_9EURO|nr:hypothetical protein N7492_002626 [Penicillium capsulatum]KAJ6122773.1 hypothetical protein N7512_005238 [Penicillium capsulatum]
MPPKAAPSSTTMPEVKGLKYDESKMALFHAKLAYHSTIDQRRASGDSNLLSISEAQAKLIKRWEMLKQSEEELADRGETSSPSDERQLALCAWRYKELEKLATQTSGK